MTHLRRLIAALLVICAALAAGKGWQAYAVAAPAASVKEASVLPLLSPRRVPEVAGSQTAEALLRDNTSKLIGPLSSGNGQVCIDIERNGRPVVNVNSNTPMIPASTAKLFTASAALDVFGEDHKFKTSVVAGEKVHDGVVSGPLYLVGNGDPLLMTKRYADFWNGHRNMNTPLEKLADSVVAAGVKDVKGGVIGDDTRFDRERYVPTWESGYRTGGQVGPIGALLVDQGFADISLMGRSPAIDPAAAAANTMAALLKERGVLVEGPSVSGNAPSDNSDIASIESLPVSGIVGEMLTESDNTTAEVMLKNIGVQVSKKGTFADGTRAITDYLRKRDFPMNGVSLVDGSGLDRSDRVTCNSITTVLAREGQAIIGSLPKAGQTGTLADRFVNTPAVGRLSAKTGTLAGVSALAGVATPEGQQPFDFAILSNGVTSATSRSVEDSLALLLVNQPRVASASLFAGG